MSTDRGFPFRYGIERVVWVGLAALFLLVQWLPIPAADRGLLALTLGAIVVYLLIVFRVLFPRTNYAPRVIYATLYVDALIVGLLRFLLADFLPNLEVAFIPLIVMAAMVSGRWGVLFFALWAALVDSVAQWQLAAFSGESVSRLAVPNQLLIAGSFALIGMVILFFSGTYRRRAGEAAQAAARVTDLERRHRQEAERTARRWELVNSVGLRLGRESAVAEIYQSLGAELQAQGLACFIGLANEAETLHTEYISLSPGLMRETQSEIPLPLAEFQLPMSDITGLEQAVAGRCAVYLRSTDPILRRLPPGMSVEALDRVSHLIGLSDRFVVPLFAESRVLGVLGVWGRDLGPSDVPTITALGQVVAASLEKGRALEREHKRAAQFALVSEVATRAAGLMDVNDLLDQVPSLITERFGFQNISILLSETSSREVVLRSHAGYPINHQAVGYRQSWNEGLIGLAARTGQTVVVNDVRNDPRYLGRPGEEICRSELCVPLKGGHENLGVLDVQSTALNTFDPVDVSALEALAGQIAAAIEKGQLLASEQKRAAQLALVSRIAEQVASILDPDRLLQSVVTLIRDHFGFHNVAILALDPRAQQLYPRAVSGVYADLFPPTYRQPVTVGLIGAAVHDGATLVVNDVSQDPRFHFPPGRASEVGSEIVIPLKIGDHVLGVLDIEAPPRNAFDASDVAAMETLANQIAIALDKAHLYAQTKGEAEVKAALLRELSHRVKNNLTAIAGLLYLRLDDDQVPRDQILTETLTRMQSMAVAHTLLTASPHARVDLAELCRRVVGDAVLNMTLPGQSIPVTLQGPSIEISAQQASSLALALNELATNAIKHGDPAARDLGALTLVTTNERVRLTLTNPGRLPEDKVPSSGLGLKLVRTLVEKDLRGCFTLTSSSEGVTGEISFVLEDAAGPRPDWS